jgi:hypothetical protein
MGLVARRGDDEGDEESGGQLSGELVISGLDGLDGAADELRFAFEAWPEAALQRLRERLELLEVVHRWDSGVLIVSEPLDPVYLDRIIGQVQQESATAAEPSDAADEIGYDLTGWDAVNRSVLFAAMEAEGIAYRLDGDELVVAEADEAQVDQFVDDIIGPDPEDEEGDAGGARPEARSEVMGELFVAADRLVHDPDDRDARTTVTDGAEVASSSSPPYGVEKAWWQGIGARTAALVALFDAPNDQGDTIIEQATELRDTLRPYV